VVEQLIEWNVSEDTSPPFEDWERLLSTFEIVEEVGPRFNTGNMLQRLEDGLFDGSRLKSVVNRQSLNWLDGLQPLKREILRKLPFDSHNGLDKVTDFAKLKATAAGLSPTYQSTVRLSKEYRVEQGLVFVRLEPGNEFLTGRSTLYYYAHVSSDWAKFFIELNTIESIITKLTLRCLREGRAICVYQDSSGRAFRMPSYWAAKPTIRGVSKSRFVITCDLPEAWRFKGMKAEVRSDLKQKADAIRWLYAEYLRPVRSDDLPNKDAVMRALETIHKLKTPKVRNEVWVETPISNWRKEGRKKNR
jgi:hypothetical protein